MKKSWKEKEEDWKKKKEEDKKAMIKLITGLILMMALISWGANYITIFIPLLVGVSVLPSGGTLKDKWKNMGKKQKGVFLLITAIFFPLILIGLIWVAMIGSMLIIDLLVFLPIFLIAGWVFFKNKKSSNMVISFLGSKYSLAMGVILLGVIIGLASYNYIQLEETLHLQDQPVDKEIKPLFQPSDIGTYVGNGTYKVKLIKNNTNNATQLSGAGTGTITDSNGKPIKTVYMKPNETVNLTIVVRDILTPEWLGELTSSANGVQKNLIHYQQEFIHENMSKNTSVDNYTRVKELENLDLNQSGIPVPHAFVSLTGEAVKGSHLGSEGSAVQFTGITNKNGIFVFHKVKQGFYWLKVSALGYRAYSLSFPVSENTTKGYFVVLLVPDYYKIRLSWAINVEVNQNRFIVWNNYNESINNNGTYVKLGSTANPLSDTDIIKTGLIVTKDIWQKNMQREQMMYSWLGVNNPNSPMFALTTEMLYTSNMLYTQSMYLNPSNPQNMYRQQGHFIWFAIAILVVIAVVLAIEHPTTQTYIKLKEVDLEIDAQANVEEGEGANPQVILMSPIFGVSGTKQMMTQHEDVGGNNQQTSQTVHKKFVLMGYNISTDKMIIPIVFPDKFETIGTPSSDYYFQYDSNGARGSITVIIWGKDLPSDVTILLNTHMKILYSLYEKHGNLIQSKENKKNVLYSDGLEDQLKIRVNYGWLENTPMS